MKLEKNNFKLILWDLQKIKITNTTRKMTKLKFDWPNNLYAIITTLNSSQICEVFLLHW